MFLRAIIYPAPAFPSLPQYSLTSCKITREQQVETQLPNLYQWTHSTVPSYIQSYCPTLHAVFYCLLALFSGMFLQSNMTNKKKKQKGILVNCHQERSSFLQHRLYSNTFGRNEVYVLVTSWVRLFSCPSSSGRLSRRFCFSVTLQRFFRVHTSTGNDLSWL